MVALVGLCSVPVVAQVPPTPNASDSQGQGAAGSTVDSSKGARDNSKNPPIRDDSAPSGVNDSNAAPNSANAPGQNAPNTADQNAANPADQNTANPADTNAAPAGGPEIVDDNATPEQKASAEYSGPAVLSRGITASEPMNPKNTKFTPTLGLDFLVNSGLTGIEQQNGTLSNTRSAGLQFRYGINGTKVLKKDVISLAFTGDLYHYTQASYLDGTDENLSLTWRHQFLRHLSLGLTETAIEYNNNNLLVSGADLINSGAGTSLVTALPSTEVFDGRVYSFQTAADLTWQVTSRFSVNMTGSGFLTRRASSALYGDTGYQAGADAAYRFTRQITGGVYYEYTHFDYTGIYGSTDVNTVGVTYSIAFTPATELITRIGGSRLETTGLNVITVDPVIAVLIGTPSVLEAVYKANYAPDFNAQIRHKVSKTTLSLAYIRGVTPGNGIILTSIRQSATFGVDYTTRRRWSFTGNAGFDSLSSFGTTLQKYASVFVGGNMNRKIARDFAWHTRLDFHHYTFDNTGFLRNSFVFATGIVWSPGNVLDRL